MPKQHQDARYGGCADLREPCTLPSSDVTGRGLTHSRPTRAKKVTRCVAKGETGEKGEAHHAGHHRRHFRRGGAGGGGVGATDPRRDRRIPGSGGRRHPGGGRRVPLHGLAAVRQGKHHPTPGSLLRRHPDPRKSASTRATTSRAGTSLTTSPCFGSTDL